MILEAEVFCVEAEVQKELPCLLFEFGVIFGVRTLFAEPLVLHLLELDGAEDEVAGVISLRNALPTCAMPKGTLARVVRCTLRKLTNSPCAVSGRR